MARANASCCAPSCFAPAASISSRALPARRLRRRSSNSRARGRPCPRRRCWRRPARTSIGRLPAPRTTRPRAPSPRRACKTLAIAGTARRHAVGQQSRTGRSTASGTVAGGGPCAVTLSGTGHVRRNADSRPVHRYDVPGRRERRRNPAKAVAPAGYVRRRFAVGFFLADGLDVALAAGLAFTPTLARALVPGLPASGRGLDRAEVFGRLARPTRRRTSRRRTRTTALAGSSAALTFSMFSTPLVSSQRAERRRALLGVDRDAVLPRRAAAQHARELHAGLAGERQRLGELGVAHAGRQVDERLGRGLRRRPGTARFASSRVYAVWPA